MNENKLYKHLKNKCFGGEKMSKLLLKFKKEDILNLVKEHDNLELLEYDSGKKFIFIK